ncbi:MAG: aldolase [SAR202 cluster bacterium]|nr:aldolase [SAR202 cluster bacterium]
MAELRKNRAKHKLAAGGTVSVPLGPMSPDLVEYMCQLDFDAIWFEGEHGPVDFVHIPDLTRACDLWGKTSIVRVNQNNYGLIYRTFDCGAMGVAVPHINTGDEAREVVKAAKFAPVGLRGSFTNRQGIGVKDYFLKANDETMVVILIEDIIAVENLDEILKVDDIDVFFVAPGDLAQTMGYPGRYDHPKVTATVERTIEKIVRSGRAAGTMVSDATVEKYAKLGVRFLSVAWTPWLMAGGQAYLDKVAGAAKKRK